MPAQVPVDTFYLVKNEPVRENFTDMATRTGGKAQFLSIGSASGAGQLLDHITTSILFHVGGAEKGQDLVGQYQKKYSKMFS